MKLKTHLLALALAVAALVATAADDKRLTVYTPQTSYTVGVLDREGLEYVALVDVLTPLGKPVARLDKDKWKLRFNDTESEFKIGKTKARVNHKDVHLSGPFLLDNGRGMAPVQSLGQVLSRLITAKLEVRDAARRVFIAGAGTQYTAELQKGAPPKLVLHFSAPVNPTIASEPGKVRMVFAREPLVGTPGTQTFDDKAIKGTSFMEHDGLAELTINAGAPVLATFGDQNRTITLAPAPPVAQVAAPPTPPTAPQTPAPSEQPGTGTGATVARARAAVVIDPGHGGEDRGAVLSPSLPEKEVTLAWARRLRSALEQKGISAMLLREGDTSLTSDQRASLANAARPVVFITLHAGSTGTGVRIYTAHLGESAPKAGSFLPWDSAQSGFLDASRNLAGSIAAEMRKREIPSGTAPVFLRPLNSIAASALAIEVMPPAGDVGGLMSLGYQQSVCAAIADGIAASGSVRAAR